jgi:sec-independent protein translocase protein TatA
MFGLGITELMVIFVIALVVFGPKRLPALGSSVGRAIAEFKKASQEFQNSVKEEIKEVEKTAQVEELKTIGQEIAAVGREQAVVLKGVAEYEQAEKEHANGAA